jgi:signal transduction histidine kinase/ligand-binding sensor domain-containing protein/DNA-binding response OmpR family regulator
MDITQDKQGFLWIATESGLNKFDGNRFITFKKYQSGISSDQLNKVLSDPDNNTLWIATQRDGLCAFDYSTETFTLFRSVGDDMNTSVNTNDITDLKPAGDGGMWITTYHRGINHYNPETKEFTHYFTNKIPELNGYQNWTAIDDKKGNLYIGHNGNGGMSVISLKDHAFKNYRNNPNDPNSLPGNEVHSIFMDKNNNIWVGTSNGLALFNPQTEKFTVFRHDPGNRSSLAANYIFNITQTTDGKLWISTNPGGVSILDLNSNLFLGQKQVVFQNIEPTENKYGLSSGDIRCVFQDSFNNIWIGSYGRGLNFIAHEQTPFHLLPYAEMTAGKQTQGLCIDHKQRIWLGNNGSIDVYENRVMKPFSLIRIADINRKQVQNIYEDSQLNIWFGINKSDIIVYQSKQNRFILLRHEKVKEINVNRFLEDPETGKIWIGSQTGIYSCTGGNRINEETTVNSQLPDLMVRSMAFDRNGNLWIGTFGRGLCVFDKDLVLKWNFTTDNGFSSNAVSHLFRDSNDRMWTGTREGLALFPDTEKEDHIVYKGNNGLEDSHIRAIIEDKQGYIWFSTNSGVSRYREQENKFDNFNYLDGVPSDFMDGSVARKNDGTLYFGSQNGVCYFNPKDIFFNPVIAPVAITQFNIYSKQKLGREDETSIPIFSKTVELPYSQNTFRISYNTLDYAQNKQVEYAYMLEGLENSWYNIQRENNVIFRNLSPGKYTFRVRARIRNQEWSNQTDTLNIHIRPPLWFSWWSKCIYGILLITIVFIAIRTYKRKINLRSQLLIEKKNHQKEQELNQERLRFYTNITHELRTPLTLILGPLEDLSKDESLQPKHINRIKIIYQSASRLLNLINQILDFRKTETQNKKLSVVYGNIANLIKETGLRYKELHQNRAVEIKTHIETEETMLYFDPEIMTTILNNLLTNAIKYTKEGEIRLILRTVHTDHKKQTEIEVSDTGFGISAEALPYIFDRFYQADGKNQASGSGIGLALVKNLVALHEGEISVESKPNEGSTFRLRILTGNTYPKAERRYNQEKEEDKTQQTGTPPSNRPILLVIEDNVDICNYIKESLCNQYDVITAYDGKEGHEQAFAHIPDMIISDIMMPGMDGLQLCKILKEDMRTSHIPIILLTAKTSLPDKTEGYQAGADSYITKPFSASLLQTRIVNLLESRKKIAKLVSSDSTLAQAENSHSLSRLDNEFLKKLNRVIEDNIDSEKIDIAFISDKMCMSHSTLYRKIKGLTEMSANEYVRKIKLQYALKLLLTEKHTVTEISYMIGINSVTYFRQCFKEEFGTTPKEYLKQNA